ncbi:MAG: hypothetical protein E7620_01205 [Ruminococcaceae bacterium]|nr:hypothetical protein [Oscillospiraceae bacterium]
MGLLLATMGGLLACGENQPVAEPSPSTAVSEELNEPAAEQNGKTLFYIHDPGGLGMKSLYNFSADSRITLPRLNAAVDEAVDAGADVFISEIYGMVPWYPSEVYSVQAHREWFNSYFQKEAVRSYLTYTEQGGDFIRVQSNRAHEKGAEYWLSYRLNDHHGMTRPVTADTANPSFVSRFYMEHQSMIIGEPQSNCDWFRYMLDFQYEEVRAYKLSLIRELIENYEIDGLMIDFMRTPALFKLSATTEEQRKEIMVSFLSEIGKALEEKSEKTGRDYSFAVKIPMDRDAYGKLGIDVSAFSREAGVDTFFLFDYFTARQEYEMLDEVRRLCPESTVVLEMGHATTWQKLPEMSRAMRLVTKEQFYTTAYLAYCHGADGVSLFNLPWYRADEETGAVYQPPFEIFRGLKDPAFLEKQPQHYFEGATENMLIHDFDLKSAVWEAGETHSFTMEMQAPEGGWKQDGVLRLESLQKVSGLDIEVHVNGVLVQLTTVLEEPYENPYLNLLGTPEQWRAYTVPAYLLQNGANEITVVNRSSSSIRLYFVDLAIR